MYRTDFGTLWRRFLRVPWTARRSSQSILKEISPEYSLKGLMLKLNSLLDSVGEGEGGMFQENSIEAGCFISMYDKIHYNIKNKKNIKRKWSWNSNILATWCKELTHWKRPLCWKRLKAGGEEDDRGSDCCMASPTQWTWAWVNSGSWWWTGKPGVLQSMGSRRVGHDWETELNWNEMKQCFAIFLRKKN